VVKIKKYIIIVREKKCAYKILAKSFFWRTLWNIF